MKNKVYMWFGKYRNLKNNFLKLLIRVKNKTNHFAKLNPKCLWCICILLLCFVTVRFYKILNLLISEYVSFSGMGIFAGLILAMLFPVVTAVYESVNDDEFNRTIIGIKLFNIQFLYTGLLIIGLPFIFWKITIARLFLFTLYLVGCCYFLNIIIRAYKWNNDWDENPNDGIRTIWRDEVLEMSKLSSTKRIVLWQSYLFEIVRKELNQLSRVWLQHFDSLYKDEKIDRYQVSDITIGFWNKNRNKLQFRFEYDFISMAIQIYLYDLNSTGINKSGSIWLKFLKEEYGNFSNKQFLLDDYSRALVDQIKNSPQQKGLEEITGILFKLLYRHYSDNIGFVYFPNNWKISSETLLNNSRDGFVQRVFLQNFFEKTYITLVRDDKNQSQVLASLNYLSFEIFRGIDSIYFGYLFEIFMCVYNYEVSTNKEILDLLMKRRIFGVSQFDDGVMKPISERQLKTNMINNRILRREESFKIINLYINDQNLFSDRPEKTSKLIQLLEKLNLEQIDDENEKEFIRQRRDDWLKILNLSFETTEKIKK
ncbi:MULTISPECIES: hypothetical protein [Amylolactobacillus]|nr:MULTISPECIES: hypothetical protein [Amylolactobacillus]GED79914.1 hypothetical protein LAM01_03870 [Amylolactobacillus amylophilus]